MLPEMILIIAACLCILNQFVNFCVAIELMEDRGGKGYIGWTAVQVFMLLVHVVILLEFIFIWTESNTGVPQ